MKSSLSIALTILTMISTLIFVGCDSDGTNCDVLGGCLSECVNQADCNNNMTCLNGGTCACFAGQNGAECNNFSDCEADEICSEDCQCVPSVNS